MAAAAAAATDAVSLKDVPRVRLEERDDRPESIRDGVVTVVDVEAAPDAPVFLEGGFGWVVVFADFVAHSCTLGLLYSYGVIYSFWLDEFGDSHSATAWPGSIAFGSFTLCNMISGPLSDRFGYRLVGMSGGASLGLSLFASSFAPNLSTLYFTYGFMVGASISLCYIPGISIIQRYFKRRKGLAVGLASSGAGFGNAVVAPLIGRFCESLGWRQTFRMFAGVFAISLIAAGACYSMPLGHGRGSRKLGFRFGIFKERAFAFFFAGMFVYSFGYFVPFAHLAEYAQEIGANKNDAATLFTILGLFTLVGRILSGAFSDSVGAMLVWIISVFVTGASTACIPLLKTLTSLRAYPPIFGLFAGARTALVSLIVGDLFGYEQLASNFGVLSGAVVPAAMLGAPLAGFLHDQTGVYTYSFVLAGCLMLAGLPSFFMVFHITSKQTEQKRGSSKNENGIEMVETSKDAVAHATRL